MVVISALCPDHYDRGIKALRLSVCLFVFNPGCFRRPGRPCVADDDALTN